MVARVSSAFNRGGHAASFPEIIRVSYGPDQLDASRIWISTHGRLFVTANRSLVH